MAATNSYKYLEPRPSSRFRQLFLKGRKISAETIYRQTIGEESRTPAEVARDYDLPLDAVLEAIEYCTHNEDLLRREREEELARIEEFVKKNPPLLPPDHASAP